MSPGFRQERLGTFPSYYSIMSIARAASSVPSAATRKMAIEVSNLTVLMFLKLSRDTSKKHVSSGMNITAIEKMIFMRIWVGYRC